MTLDQLFNEWLYINHKDDIKPRTLLRYECSYKTNISPYYGNNLIETLTSRDIQNWINEMKNRVSRYNNKHLSSSSINIALMVIKMMFKYAEDFEILQHNPSKKVKFAQNLKQIKQVQAFTREEQIKLERYIDGLNNDEYFVYILTLYTGLRLGEVTGLMWKDINLKTGVMNISRSRYKTRMENGEWKYIESIPKTKNSIREVPLPTFIKDKLQIMKKERKSKYVVCRNNGKQLTDKVIVWRLAHIEKKLKMRHLSFHSLRHTFATRALESKMDIKTLSEILGHSSIVITLNVYTHSLINHKKQQMRKLKRII